MATRQQYREYLFRKGLGKFLAEHHEFLKNAKRASVNEVGRTSIRDTIIEHMFSYTKIMVSGKMPHVTNKAERESSFIRGNFLNSYTGSRRTPFRIDVGGKASAKYLKGGTVTSSIVKVSLGYLWNRRVFKPIIQGRLINHDLIILSAERVAVNRKQFDMYRCQIFNFKTKQQEEWYVAVTDPNICNDVAYGKTPSIAAKAMEDAIVKKVGKAYSNGNSNQ